MPFGCIWGLCSETRSTWIVSDLWTGSAGLLCACPHSPGHGDHCSDELTLFCLPQGLSRGWGCPSCRPWPRGSHSPLSQLFLWYLLCISKQSAYIASPWFSVLDRTHWVTKDKEGVTSLHLPRNALSLPDPFHEGTLYLLAALISNNHINLPVRHHSRWVLYRYWAFCLYFLFFLELFCSICVISYVIPMNPSPTI